LPKSRTIPFPATFIGLLLLFFLFPPPLPALTPQELNAQAIESLHQGDGETALNLLKEAQRSLPFDETIRKNISQAYLQIGLEHLKNRRFDDAADAFHEGKTYGSDDPRFWVYRGYAFLRKGEMSAAESEFDVALGMSGEDPSILKLLAKVYYDSGRLYESMTTMEQVLDRTPDDSEAREFLEKVRREFDVEDSMSRELGANFSISYDGEAHPDLGEQVLDVLEEAYAETGSDFDFYPNVQVPVILYTRRDFLSITASPDWAGGLYDGKIRIPVGGIREMTPQLRAVLYHEYTHVLLRYLAGNEIPAWLNEGLAEIAGRRHFSTPLNTLKKAFKEGKLLDFAEIDRSFSSIPSYKVPLAYEQSYSFVNFLIGRYGRYMIGDLLQEIRLGMTVCEAVGKVYGNYRSDCDSLQNEWVSSLNKQ